MSPEPPDARGVTGYRPYFPDDVFQQLPDCRPWLRPPECQPELGQLTDSGREERDRAQSLCKPRVKPLCIRTALVGNAPYCGGYLKYEAWYNYVYTLSLPYHYVTFDGGGISPVEEIITHHMCTAQLCLHPT